MTSILVLNGPNLNMLGTRQPEIYGATSLADIEALCARTAEKLGCDVTCVQSNYEGALVDRIQAALGSHQGIVLNAGAYTHTSVALRDAVSAVQLPVIELHISNVFAREAFRHHSYIAPVAVGVIAGLGVQGYARALEALVTHLGAVS